MSTVNPIHPQTTSDEEILLSSRPQIGCVQNAFANLRSFFQQIGLINLVGSTVVILTFAFVSNLAAAVVLGLFGVAKIGKEIFCKEEPPPAPAPPSSGGSADSIA